MSSDREKDGTAGKRYEEDEAPDLEKEFELLKKAKAHLESESPLREIEMTPEAKKRFPRIYVPERKADSVRAEHWQSPILGKQLEDAVAKYGLPDISSRPNAGATAICGKVEAELSEMSDEDAAEFLSSYGLKESGLFA